MAPQLNASGPGPGAQGPRRSDRILDMQRFHP